MKKITGRQCLAARGLLKWNLYDLANRTSVPLKRIDSFEKSIFQLLQPENEEIMAVLEKNGVEFLDSFEVRLNKSGVINDSAAPDPQKTVGNDQIEVIIVTDNYIGPDRRAAAEEEERAARLNRGRRKEDK